MARARLLKPGFFANGELAALPPHARLLFAGLWTLADREGRLKDDVLWIKGQLFPHEDVDVDDLLTKLVQSRFVVRYGARTNKYLAVTNFKKHQTPHIREPESQIPEPPKKHSASTMPAPDKHQASTGKSRTSPAVTVTVTESVPVTDPVAVPRRGHDPLNDLISDFAKIGVCNERTVDLIESDAEHYGIEAVRVAIDKAAGSGADGLIPWNYIVSILEGKGDHTRNGTHTSGGPAAGSYPTDGTPGPAERIYVPNPNRGRDGS